ncbi:MAG: glycoside hydrolase family 78 protein [Bacteroidales bacterium]|nr:glycoside hydrolase family 78 protein [Bacteroidales bacterium]MCM1416800.1 glycoside hydrolase family 78 protein [bacterium]MCM1424872.1 glycoside hydrolase family 78 protein [bacterium]
MLHIERLQINHLENPFGISVSPIRLTWTLGGSGRQTSFEAEILLDGEIVETSGVVRTSDMFWQSQRELAYKTDYIVKVKVTDEAGSASESAEIAVTTGIGREQWRARWIDPESAGKSFMQKFSWKLRDKLMLPGVDLRTYDAGAYLKKEFRIDKAFRKARLYVTAHGIVNVRLNGKEITDAQLLPGTSQYNRRLMMETIDVSGCLKQGDNILEAALGDGWYRGSMGYRQYRHVYGDDIALLAQLELDDTPIVVTDESWSASTDGPLGLNDMMAGEQYDARKEETMTWHKPVVRNFGFDCLICRDTVPMKLHECFVPELIRTPAGENVLDFGQNIAGVIEFAFEGKAGQKLALTHGETLDGNGNFTTDNFQAWGRPVRQQIVYICKDGKNSYRPTKTYMGFRYVKVEADFPIKKEWFKAYALYSDMRQTAFFTCGVEEVNKLFQNAVWSMKGNFVDIPTDCPTREKAGYSGDCQTFVDTAMYLMDCYPVYAKWLREQAAAQFEDGCVPQLAPTSSLKKTEEDGGIGWSDSFEIVPWALYRRYGDDTLMRELYEPLTKWMAYRQRQSGVMRRANQRIVPKEMQPYTLDHEWLWGEWLEPGADTAEYRRDLRKYGDLEVSTAYMHYSHLLMSQIAETLRRSEDAAKYRKIAKRAKEAYRYLFVEDGRIKPTKRQCRYVRPTALNLLDEKEKREAVETLAKLIKENGDHIGTGFLTTHELCRALCRYGQAKKAYDLLLQRERPGWLYPVLHGATTVPESWDAYQDPVKRVESMNHYAYGAVAGWLIDSAAGIRLEHGKIIIQPYPDRRLCYVNAVYDSPSGRIGSSWRYEGDKIIYEFMVPANAEAVVILRDKTLRLTSGTHSAAEEIK